MNARVLAAALAPICLLCPAAARAQVLMPTPSGPEPPPAPGAEPSAAPAASFGAPSQVVLSSDLDLRFTTSVKAETSSLTLRPALDVFIAPHLTLGGQIGVEVTKPKSADAVSAFQLGVRMGYDAPLGDYFSIWPRGGLLYDHTSSDDRLSLLLDVPILLHPVPHFFIGLAPTLIVDLAGNFKDVTMGFFTTVGGWIDW